MKEIIEYQQTHRHGFEDTVLARVEKPEGRMLSELFHSPSQLKSCLSPVFQLIDSGECLDRDDAYLTMYKRGRLVSVGQHYEDRCIFGYVEVFCELVVEIV